VRSLPRPAYSARSVLELCSSSIRDADLAQRLQLVSAAIDEAEANYLGHAESASFSAIPTANDVANIVAGHEMKTLYKGTFSRKGSRVRPIYDELKAARETHGICPLCGQRDVSTLDHYLAQSLHPSLTVTPINLVPACAPCNKAKLDRQPATVGEQTLHPYFDEIGDMVWLKAQVVVVEQEKPALVFSVEPPEECSEVMRERLHSHFAIFGLGTLYSTHAGVELINNRLILMQMAGQVGVEGFRSHFLEQANSRRAIDPNSWQCAMYDALAASDWFCREGYTSIR
jgi:hypothetical protein